MRHAVVLLATLGCAAAGVAAFELTLSPRALAEAVDVGQSRLESVRTRFHQPYRIPVSRPPIDYVDVVTPFRRVALAAESRARIGERLFGQREALAVLGATPQQIDVLVEMTFHPQNAMVAVPNYQVRLAAGSAVSSRAAIEPRDIDRVPRFGTRMDGFSLLYRFPTTAPPIATSQPMTGGTLIVRLDGQAIDPDGAYDLFVIDAGKEVGRARVNFGVLR